jgi:hypothetical protein
MAMRARRLALTIPGDEGAKRLVAFATELGAQADPLEIVEVKPPSAR